MTSACGAPVPAQSDSWVAKIPGWKIVATFWFEENEGSRDGESAARHRYAAFAFLTLAEGTEVIKHFGVALGDKSFIFNFAKSSESAAFSYLSIGGRWRHS